MKLFALLSALFILTASADKCGKKASGDKVYKGKLEIKALCMNYTIKVLEGNMDTSLLVPSWTNESTGQTHTDVFGLGSRCNFPATINQGDEFYFTIDNNDTANCAVCMAYYPTPPKKLSIKIVEK
jgi:hypothetical protein